MKPARRSARWRLQWDLLVWRHGWLAPGLLSLAGLLFAHEAWRWQRARDALQTTRHPRPVLVQENGSQSTATAPPAHDLRQRLPASSTPAEAAQALLNASQQAGLRWPQANHRNDGDAIDDPARWRVTQTTPGTYPTLRRAVLTTLAALPHVSLDRVSARRDAEGQGALDTTLEWSIWTRPPAGPGQPPSPRPEWRLRERTAPSAESPLRDLFARLAPPAPAPTDAPPPQPEPTPAAATLPPPELKVLGKQWDGERWLVFATDGADTVVLREGDRLQDGHRVERIAPPTLLLRRDGADAAEPIAIGEAP